MKKSDRPSLSARLLSVLDAHEDCAGISASLAKRLSGRFLSVDENGRTPACRSAYMSKKLLAKAIIEIGGGEREPDHYRLCALDYLAMVNPATEVKRRARELAELKLRIRSEPGLKEAAEHPPEIFLVRKGSL